MSISSNASAGPRAADLLGQAVGNYSLIKVLGEGGMGAVYLGENAMIESQVAIKVLQKHLAGDEEVIRRLLDEARAVNRVKHPGIVRIHDCGEAEPIGVYLVMELLDGETLRDTLKRRRTLPPGEVTEIIRQAASVLGKVHETRIIHRDLKPENIFLVDDPQLPGGKRVKVLDFGIAKLIEDAAAIGGGHTKTGVIFGTPYYMSPEQCYDSKNIDRRTDIYALGVIAYELLCGGIPFKADSIGQLVKMHLTETPRHLGELCPHAPPGLIDLVHHAMATDAKDRPRTMEEMAAALDALDHREAAPADPVREAADVATSETRSPAGAGTSEAPEPVDVATSETLCATGAETVAPPEPVDVATSETLCATGAGMSEAPEPVDVATSETLCATDAGAAPASAPAALTGSGSMGSDSLRQAGTAQLHTAPVGPRRDGSRLPILLAALAVLIGVGGGVAYFTIEERPGPARSAEPTRQATIPRERTPDAASMGGASGDISSTPDAAPAGEDSGAARVDRKRGATSPRPPGKVRKRKGASRVRGKQPPRKKKDDPPGEEDIRFKDLPPGKKKDKKKDEPEIRFKDL